MQSHTKGEGSADTSIQTLPARFAWRVSHSGDRPAISFDGNTSSYSVFAEQVTRLAAALYSAGVRKGDRVGFLGFNCPEVIATMLAATSIGAIFVPFNFRLTASELALLLEDSAVSVLLTGSQHVGLIDPIKTTLACRRFVQVGGEAGGWTMLGDFLAAADTPIPAIAIDPADVATIIYTSGTTGQPKGAMLTHANLWANDVNWMLSYSITPDDVLLTTAPMFHVSGLFVLLSTVLLAGGHIVLHQGFEAGAVVGAIEGHRVTMTFAVPTMILAITQHERFETVDFSSLRFVIVGGAPIAESLLLKCSARGIPISHTFGMTEVVSAATFLEPALGVARLNSVGRPMALSAVDLAGPDGSSVVEAHVRGEIRIRGDQVIKGYWKRPEATASAFSADGWYHTGDVGYFDADGFLYVCDRIKDMVISGGENVYPAEVESVLLEHSAVANAAVVGAPDERWGEIVVAVLVLKAGRTLTLSELLAFCGPRLARYKLPKRLHILDALPLNGAGKVVKQPLRELIKTGQGVPGE